MITNSEIRPADHSASQHEGHSFMSKLLGGEFGLAVTYWLLFFLGASSFFIFGSQAVDQSGGCCISASSLQHWPTLLC